MTPIKKAELHTHLEGTIRPALAQKLAKRNHLAIPPNLISEDGETYLYQDFAHFLKTFDVIANLIKTPRDYYDLTLEYLQINALENTIYTEMMYSPDHAEYASKIPSTEHLQAIQQAIDDAESKWGIIGRIIIVAVRHFGEEAVLQVAKQAIKETVPCIVGFGLGGDEIRFPPHLFKKAYEIVNKEGLCCTIHAGEFSPAASMLDAINSLPLQRIGHGVQAMHSAEVMTILKQRQIALEICPSSNIMLGLFADLSSHPLPLFLDAGISLSLNSDDPPFFRTHLGEEYTRVQDYYHYSDTQMEAFTKMAIEAAFVDESTKKRLRQQLS